MKIARKVLSYIGYSILFFGFLYVSLHMGRDYEQNLPGVALVCYNYRGEEICELEEMTKSRFDEMFNEMVDEYDQQLIESKEGACL